MKLTPRQWLTLEHDFLAPTFDGDSIWNVFSIGAYRDLRASYEIGLPRGVKAYARGFARFYLATTDEVAPPDAVRRAGRRRRGAGRAFAAGGSLGAAWRNARGMLRADGYWDDGYGGRKVGVDATTRVKRARRALELEGRLTGYAWRNDLQPATDSSGVVFGAAGRRAVPARAGGRACTCWSRTTSAPTTRASSAGWRCWSSTRRYEALARTSDRDGRRRRRRPRRSAWSPAWRPRRRLAGDDAGGAGRAGACRAGAVAAHLPGRDDPASSSITRPTRAWARPARAATHGRRRRRRAGDNLIPGEAACRSCHKIDRAQPTKAVGRGPRPPRAATPATSTAAGERLDAARRRLAAAAGARWRAPTSSSTTGCTPPAASAASSATRNAAAEAMVTRADLPMMAQLPRLPQRQGRATRRPPAAAPAT